MSFTGPTIVCWLWSDPGYRWNGLYIPTARHVNRLYQALEDTMKGPWRMVCLTDQPDCIRTDGIRPEVRVLPVPTLYADLGGCWRRLWLFSDEAAELGEKLVQIDLDVAVLGDLSELFDRDDDFVAWESSVGGYCGSMWMLRAGSCREVWDEFHPLYGPAAVADRIGTDQAWTTHVLGPNRPLWTRKDGIYSFRRNFSGGALVNRERRLGRFRTPPEDCRAVFFHGPFDPSMERCQKAFPWLWRYWNEDGCNDDGATVHPYQSMPG